MDPGKQSEDVNYLYAITVVNIEAETKRPRNEFSNLKMVPFWFKFVPNGTI